MAWWPLVLGLLVTPLALKTAEILPLLGADGLFKLRMLYPYSAALQQHAWGLQEQTADKLAQFLTFAQFPLYGLWIGIALRWRSIGNALLQVLVVHAAAFCIAWMMLWG